MMHLRFAVLAVLSCLVLGTVGTAAPVRGADYDWFSCPTGSGHLSTATPEVSAAQGQTVAVTVDIERVGCTDPISFWADGMPSDSSVTWSENPTTAASVILSISTSRTWPAITPVGTSRVDIHLDTGSSYPAIYLGVDLSVTASGTPIAAPPIPTLGLGTVGSATVGVKTSWSAVDPNGIKSYGLQRQVNGGAWQTVPLPSKTQKSITQLLKFKSTYRYRVRATDKLGHIGAYTYGPSFTVRLVQQTSANVTSAWSYRTVRTSLASGGSLKYQPYSGSDFTYTFNAASVAWVSVKGPTRTNVMNYAIDGVFNEANFSLNAKSTQYRRIVVRRNFGANGAHSLYVQNLGMIGHSRLDIDAFVLLTYK